MSVGKGNGEDAEQQVGDGEVDEELLQVWSRPLSVELHQNDQRVGGEGEEGDQGVEDDDRRLTTGPKNFQSTVLLLLRLLLEEHQRSAATSVQTAAAVAASLKQFLSGSPHGCHRGGDVGGVYSQH